MMRDIQVTFQHQAGEGFVPLDLPGDITEEYDMTLCTSGVHQAFPDSRGHEYIYLRITSEWHEGCVEVTPDPTGAYVWDLALFSKQDGYTELDIDCEALDGLVMLGIIDFSDDTFYVSIALDEDDLELEEDE